ncbi:MAG: hypothetical protein M1120_02395 [Patescibacteria group bacterium]|nr:hypothetical protein [Patescibacteria group bacterium]
MFTLIPKAYAQVDIGTSYKLGEGGPGINTVFYGLAQLVSPLIKNVFILAGIVLLILLIFGGVTYIINAGSGDKEGMEKGQNALTSAILGFIIIFAAYWLVQIAAYVTGIHIFDSGL